ncbi:MAG: shikimate dehydrogenase family protein [Flavobacteriaceae bacterium]
MEENQNKMSHNWNWGASKAVEYVLTNNNIATTFVSRNPKKNQISYSKISSEIINTHKLIINCTPIGTYPNINIAPKIDYNLLTSEHFLFDLIYNPSETMFLKEGKARGCKTLNGNEMLKEQADKAWSIWNQ